MLKSTGILAIDEMKKIFRKMFEKKEDKKRSLSNDFIERMIRTEQAVSSTFGEHVPYKKTSCYKELSEKEKEDFESYLKNKKRVNGIFTAFSLIMIISFIFVNVQFTGRAIENVTGLGSSTTSVFLIAVVLIGLVVFIVILMLNKIKNKKFRKRFDILDNLIARRYSLKTQI